MVGVVVNARAQESNAESNPERKEQQTRKKTFPVFSQPKPDKDVFKTSATKLNEDIKTLVDRIEVLKAQIEAQRQVSRNMSPEMIDAKNLLNYLSGEFSVQLEQRRSLKTELDNWYRSISQLKSDARAFREKHRKSDLKNLELVPEYQGIQEQIERSEKDRALVQEKIVEKDKLLTELKEKVNAQKMVVDDLRAKGKPKGVDISALATERSQAYEKIKTLRTKLNKLRLDFQAENQEWFDKKQAFTQEQNAQRERSRKEWVRRQAEYKKEQAERQERRMQARKQWEIENFVEKYTDEIITCDQLLGFLQALLPAASEVDKATTVKMEIPTPAGFGNLLPSKKDREAEMESWFAGTKKVGKKAKAVNKVREKLTLSVEILNGFTKIMVTAPRTNDEVSTAVKAVKEKKEHYTKLQAVCKAEREAKEKKMMEMEAASASAEDVSASAEAASEEAASVEGLEEDELEEENLEELEENNSAEEEAEQDSLEDDEKIEDTTESTASSGEEKADGSAELVVELAEDKPVESTESSNGEVHDN